MTHKKKLKLEDGFSDLSREAESWEIEGPSVVGTSSKSKDKAEKKPKTAYVYPSLYLRDVPVPEAPVGEEMTVQVRLRINEKTERESDSGKSCTMDVEVIGIKWPSGTELEEPSGDDSDAIERGLNEAMEDEE